ncbi:hypothetical protein, unknown function [Leishmania donovani]|uniref:GNAT acetyltransferase family protein n=1 Tax=Leishmania donovani TaxID=5661 RepID=E9BJ76_LEIDO|nr:hypothetical protein, unknown function [Leishmania donovani]CBZ35302.1 hypothetical protein, unknown function [Leishmania donovani]
MLANTRTPPFPVCLPTQTQTSKAYTTTARSDHRRIGRLCESNASLRGSSPAARTLPSPLSLKCDVNADGPCECARNSSVASRHDKGSVCCAWRGGGGGVWSRCSAPCQVRRTHATGAFTKQRAHFHHPRHVFFYLGRRCVYAFRFLFGSDLFSCANSVCRAHALTCRYSAAFTPVCYAYHQGDMPARKQESEAVKALFHYPCHSFIVRSALEGHMGQVTVRGSSAAATLRARITVGVFTVLAGAPDAELVSGITTSLVVPVQPEWIPLIEAHSPALKPYIRYPMVTATGSFDVRRLQQYAAACPAAYVIEPITEALAERTRKMKWSFDLCGNFRDAADFAARGIGFVALERATGNIAAGASSFAICDGGVEVEVDTAESHQRRGLALACSARLILECLKRGLYPNWDAHVPHSAHLAEKLGYTRGTPYKAYVEELPT